MDHPVHRKSPFTQQSRGCGLPGDFITIPYQFFTNWNQTLEVYGDPAKVFVHEWAKFRYGIFDEFGFSGDDLYPNYYKVDGQMVPTGSSDLLIKGAWLKQGIPCDPSDGQEGPQVCNATFFKGQLISKCPYEKSVSSKIPTEISLEFCPEIFVAFWASSSLPYL